MHDAVYFMYTLYDLIMLQSIMTFECQWLFGSLPHICGHLSSVLSVLSPPITPCQIDIYFTSILNNSVARG